MYTDMKIRKTYFYGKPTICFDMFLFDDGDIVFKRLVRWVEAFSEPAFKEDGVLVMKSVRELAWPEMRGLCHLSNGSMYIRLVYKV